MKQAPFSFLGQATACLCLLLLIAGCASTTSNVSSFADSSQVAALSPPATFHVVVTAVPTTSLIDQIWGEFYTTILGQAKPPPLEQVVKDKVTAALRAKGLVPGPPGRAALVVRAAFDVKTTHRLTYGKEYNSDKEKYEYKHRDTTHYDYWLRLAVLKADAASGIIWQGDANHSGTSSNVRNTLDYLIVAVVSRWGQSTLGRDRVKVTSDNPLYKQLNQGQ